MMEKGSSIVKAVALFAAAFMFAGEADALALEAGKVEVVLPAKPLPVEMFAAQEMTNFLSRVLGAPVPVVEVGRKRSVASGNAILLGRAAGFDVSDFGRDEFRTKIERSADGSSTIRIAGRDGKTNPLKNLQNCERATLFGVYAFLEDSIGCRFYFPGVLGEVVPKQSRIELAEIDRRTAPDFSVREWYNGKRAFWFGKTANDAEGERMKNLDWLRLRMGTRKIPLCHGTRKFHYIERFAKTHPEYFSLRTNGTRTFDKSVSHTGHLCWTSPVVDELFEDVKAALTGKNPSDRGIPLKRWGSNVDLQNRIVDIMPQDGQPECACEKCQKLYRAGKDPVWMATKSIAERLTAAGVKGTVTQMCYGRSRKVPDYSLPSNILVQVAVRGQWSCGIPDRIANERRQMEDWVAKLGHKVWLWTYPGKHPSVGPNFDGIPQLSMHAWGQYFKDVAGLVTGCFSESESDRFSFNYLNYYVYSRVCWDNKTDIDAVLDEHYRLMFGAGAHDMKELYTTLERKWMTRLAGKSQDTPIGPVAAVPSWKEIFTEIYPSSEIARLDSLVAAALSKVAPDSLEARRIRLMSDEFVGGIKTAADAYFKRAAMVERFRAKAETDIPLSVFKWRGRMPDIDRALEAKVKTWVDDTALHAKFVCEEPNMDKVAAKVRPHDDGEIWADNSVEWYFCPTGERGLAYQVAVNSEGAIFDIVKRRIETGGLDIDKSWGKGIVATVEKGGESWTCSITVPFSAIGGKPVREVPMCFARNRVVSGMRGTALYVWAPEVLVSFGNSENFGTVEYPSASSVRIAPDEVEVLVAPKARSRQPVAWFAAGELTNFLSRAFGKVIPVVSAPTPGKTAIVVGTNEWSAAAGVDVLPLSRDGFMHRTVPGRIYIAGRDSAKFNPSGNMMEEKATLFAVYDFLERHVGCRFYFPGVMGEVVPQIGSFSVPVGEFTDAPDFTVRSVRKDIGVWYEPVSKARLARNDALCRYRWRLQTERIPCCHGLREGHYIARFGKTHPEYFCKLKDGSRTNIDKGPSDSYRGQLCHSSDVWEEIYKDARSYFLGEGPEVRGMMAERNSVVVPGHEWRWQVSGGKYYDVMPQDSMHRCWCEKCAAAFAKAKDPAQYATELLWGRVAECAQRLIDEGIPGNLTMMSYNPYKNVPDFNIPTNVVVMVCSNGAWAKEKYQERDLARLKAWIEKCGRKLHIWNNCGKHVCFNLNYVDMPGITPRAYAKYYKRLAPHIFGAYCDNQSEKFIYSALNYYLYSRFAWNNDVDTDALLEEYYRLMFGKGADAMRRFDEEMEDIWMNEIISTQIETALGPMNSGISAFELWNRIVDVKRIRKFEAMFDEAAKSVLPDSMAAKRIRFFRSQILEPMAKHAAEYDSENGVANELAARKLRKAVSIVENFQSFELNVDSTNKWVHAKAYPLKLKPGRTYRVSYALSGGNLDQYWETPEELRIRKMWGGVQGVVKCKGKNLASIGRGIRGTFKPVVQAFEFTAPEGDGQELPAELKLQTVWTMGRARFDSLMVEELD